MPLFSYIQQERMMKRTPLVVDVLPVRNEMLSPEEYLALTEKSPGAIERAEFVPPTPGKPGFGSFFVRYRRGRERHRASSLMPCANGY